jgi:long-chain acyl-CoA synthetase
MLTHGNLHSNADAAIVHAGIKRADTFLGVLPQFHSFGLTALTLIPLRIGARVVYSARFIPKKIVELVRRYRPDIVMAVPSMYGALLSVKGATPDDFTSVRLAISGGEPLPEAVYTAFLEKLNLRILEGYGLTETAPVTNWSTPQRFVRRAVGTCLPNVDEKIVDEHNRPLPAGHEGEILITGPNIMKGYYKLPGQTRDVFIDLPLETPHGRVETRRYFRTGDIGKMDADGFLFITGRKKEMLIIGGENVFPREIEEVLNKHPSVRDSAVIGRTDGLRGEVPVAFVETQDGADFDEKALRSWCRESLAGYKVPREIHAVDTLPRSPTGKILRRELKAD